MYTYLSQQNSLAWLDGSSVENIFYLFRVEVWHPNGSDQAQGYKFLQGQPGLSGMESLV